MTKKSTGFLAEFRQFIARGSVMDMAIGVIIGGAFKTIVDSLCQDILMPLIGIFVGKDTFSSLAFHVAGATVTFGNFIQAIVNFLIMALVIFGLVKMMNRLHHEKKKEPSAPPTPSREEVLLTEIRDLLKEQK